MNKLLTFLVAILSIVVIDLFNFEAPPSASQNTNAIISADLLAPFTDDVVDSTSGFGLNPAIQSQSNGDPSSISSGSVFDPVTMFLLGSGLIGLAGLGRKKT